MVLKPVIRIMAAGMVLLALPGPAAAVTAEQKVRVVLDGSVQHYGSDAFLSEGVYYVPVRGLLERLGYSIVWNSGTGGITAVKRGSHELRLAPGSPEAVVDAKTFDLQRPLVLEDGTAYMPAGPILGMLGYRVDTNSYKGQLYIESPVWLRIADALGQGGDAVRLEGEPVGFGNAQEVTLYLDGERVYTGEWSSGGMNGVGKVYDGGRLVYEGGLKDNEPEGWGILYDRNGDRYEGNFADGIPEGQGRRYVSDRLLYDGEWSWGTFEGQGKLFHSAGKEAYEGGFAGGVRAGYGVQFDEAGNIQYEGNWANDTRSGFGRTFNRDGRIDYEGQWEHGVKHGKGNVHVFGKVKSYGLDSTNVTSVQESDVLYIRETEYDNGLKIWEAEQQWMVRAVSTKAEQGAFSERGLLNGPGEKSIVKGTIPSEAGLLNDWERYYVGDFKFGQLTGSGVFYDKQGNKIYEGQVLDGIRQGQGVSYRDGIVSYQGGWEDDVPHGRGWDYKLDGSRPVYENSRTSYTITEAAYKKGVLSSTGDVYKVYGSFGGGTFSGKGMQVWVYDGAKRKKPSGSILNGEGLKVYDGELKHGLRHGEGEEYLPDGSTYTGDFASNVRSGTGILDGEDFRYEGKFSDNLKNGQGKLYKGSVLSYDGEWKDDKRHGFGISYRKGVREYEGEFANDKKNGYGWLYDRTGKTIVYRGEFKDDMTLEQYKLQHP